MAGCSLLINFFYICEPGQPFYSYVKFVWRWIARCDSVTLLLIFLSHQLIYLFWIRHQQWVVVAQKDLQAALLSAGYKRADVTRSKLQAVSKQKCRIKNALWRTEQQEIRRGYYIKTKAKRINDGSTSGISSVTDPTSEAINNKSSLELESTHASAAQSATSNFTTKASAAL